MVGQWFESVLEQELLVIEKISKAPQKDVEVNVKKLKRKKYVKRMTNKDIKAGDFYEGSMINPSYSKLSRRMVDYVYVKKILEECKFFSDSKLQ